MSPLGVERLRGIALACVLPLLGACFGTRGDELAAPASPGAFAPESGEPVLYARDGSVVEPSAAFSGRPEAADAPIRGVQPRDESRMQLLDLYQRVVAEKEALALEVGALDATLASTRAGEVALAHERDELLARVAALEADVARGESENADLAARLTTAQIRRLEAEKLLLEAKLAAARAAESYAETQSTKSARRGRETSGARTEGARTEPAAVTDAPPAETGSAGSRP